MSFKKGQNPTMRFERRFEGNKEKGVLWGTVKGFEATVPLHKTTELASKEGRRTMRDLEQILLDKVDAHKVELAKRRRAIDKERGGD